MHRSELRAGGDRPGWLGGDAGPGICRTGFVDEDTKLALVAGAGVVLQPSYMESFSLALMEGWILERPSAGAASQPGARRTRRDRSAGGLAYGDYLDFEAALEILRRSPSLGAALGAAGRRYVLEQFAWPRVSAAFVEAVARAEAAGRQRLGARGATTPGGRRDPTATRVS